MIGKGSNSEYLLAGTTHLETRMREVIRVTVGVDQLGAVVMATDVSDSLLRGREGMAAHVVGGRTADRTPLERAKRW